MAFWAKINGWVSCGVPNLSRSIPFAATTLAQLHAEHAGTAKPGSFRRVDTVVFKGPTDICYMGYF